ncbi:MAG: MFS transporter, partial [Rhodanobacteraceae bacterium]
VPGSGVYLASGAVIAVALLGFAASRAIPPAPATAPELRFNWNPFAETARVLRIVREDRTVFVAIIGISWFWFFGSVFTAQLPNYTRVDLGGSESVSILVLALFAIGTGTGSLLCEKLSRRRVEPGIVPLGAFGLSAFGIDLFFARHAAPPAIDLDWSGFLGAPGSARIATDLAMLGVSAGLFVVPLFALVQSRTAPSQLSRVIAGNNVINAVFIVIAALGAIGLQSAGLTIPQVFLITALLNALMAVYLFVRVPEFVARFVQWIRVRDADREI